MDFYEMLDQVVDLLRRRQRVTCCALKRQLNGVQLEIIEMQR